MLYNACIAQYVTKLSSDWSVEALASNYIIKCAKTISLQQCRNAKNPGITPHPNFKGRGLEGDEKRGRCACTDIKLSERVLSRTESMTRKI